MYEQLDLLHWAASLPTGIVIDGRSQFENRTVAFVCSILNGHVPPTTGGADPADLAAYRRRRPIFRKDGSPMEMVSFVMDDRVLSEIQALREEFRELRDALAGGHQSRPPEPGQPWSEGDILSTKQAAPLLHVKSDSAVIRRGRGKAWARQIAPGANWQFSRLLIVADLVAHDLQDRSG
jgi:hypothetical protein